MRSRYTAFAMSNSVYLLDTWHSSTRPPTLLFEREQRWLGLKIVNTTDGLAGDDSGMVQFVARYKIAGRAHRLEELSRFTFEQGRWFYVDAVTQS